MSVLRLADAPVAPVGTAPGPGGSPTTGAGADATARWLVERVRAELRYRLPVDGLWAGVTDPRTALVTSLAGDGPPVASGLDLAAEYAVPDVNKIAWLAGRPNPVGVLSAATGGKPTDSYRYRRFLAPRGIEHELRAALADRGLCWGFLVLLRGAQRPDFAPAEVLLVRSAVRTLVGELRSRLMLAPSGTVSGWPAGVLLVGADGAIEDASPAAFELFRRLRQAGDGAVPPTPFAALAASLRVPPWPDCRRMLLPDPEGGWLAVTGRRLGPRAARSRVVISFEPASPKVTAPLVLQARGLTDRQIAVAMCLLEGMTNAEIADHLKISAHTVQDHIKVNFARFGVQSRRAFVRAVAPPGETEGRTGDGG